ncbi:MAG: threonine--tRNA ligase [Candidatus Diapherotrites archaeon]|nr:threonine--tRNA ligase [Candidatus Micrarchaeota archaeon]MBU1939265.1 threonine--tRNA ligase [Candidatus Micrarchaeota archaeon]
MKIKITLPDGSVQQHKHGVTGTEIAQGIGARLAKDALAVKVDGRALDLNARLEKDAKFEILTWESKGGAEVLWHSASHVLAEAVLALFPKAKLAIGPAIEQGFYYDFDVANPFTPADLEKIEKKIGELLKTERKFERSEIGRKDAVALFKGNPYKKELIHDLEPGKISVYRHGKFVDLCAGPHIPSTANIGAVKLLKAAGAYWRGSEKNKMLQRIYGIAFPKEKMLAEFLKMHEEAEKRNHLKLGKELDLFSMQGEAPGAVFWHPKGMVLVNEITDFMRRELQKRNYGEVSTPLILKKQLWLQSGHWEHYKDNMYFIRTEDGEFAVRPMNCPGGILVFNNKRHSYRDLPIRMAEFGTVYRNEMSGVLNGLFRVRKFTQDDAHVFMTEGQIEREIAALIELVEHVYSSFGFDNYEVELSTKPEKAMGSAEVWRNAEQALMGALEKKKMKFTINEGDGAFYGPKIDFHIKDSLGRRWQLGTIQLDFSMPEKFDLKYWGNDDKEHRPVMLHRAILGSIERFIGILIEHYAGAFPLWLSPVQVKVIAVADRFNNYALEVMETLLHNGIRAEFDVRTESVPYKVRDAQMKKANYIVVVGEREQKERTVTVRNRGGELFPDVKPEKFTADLLKEIAERK